MGKPAGWGGNGAKRVADLLGEHGWSDLARMCWPSGLRAGEAGDTKRSKMESNKNKRELDNDTETVSCKEGRRKSKRRTAGTEGGLRVSMMQLTPPSQSTEQNNITHIKKNRGDLVAQRKAEL